MNSCQDLLQEKQGWLISHSPICTDVIFLLSFSPCKTILTLFIPLSMFCFFPLGFHKTNTQSPDPHIKSVANSRIRQRDRERESERKMGRQRERQRMRNVTHPGMRWWWLCVVITDLWIQTELSRGAHRLWGCWNNPICTGHRCTVRYRRMYIAHDII